MISPKAGHQEEDGGGLGNASSYGMQNRQPNKFDGLCDGVLNTLSMMHSSVQEV